MLTDVDLPAPGLLWTRWAALSAVTTGTDRGTLWSVDPSGARHDDPATGWARFALLDGRRAVLYGAHHDHHAAVSADPAADPLTGAPDWLPWSELTSLAESDQLGFVLWHDQGRWSRVRYRRPYEDGLADVLWPLLTEADAVAALHARHPRAVGRTTAAALLHAAIRGEVDAGHLTALLGEEADIPAALAIAGRAGLTPGTTPPRIPPGRRPAMRRVRHLSHGEHDRLVWAAMHDAAELRRPAPPDTEELGELVRWLRERAPAGDGRCSLLAYADATSFSSQPGDHPPASRPAEERYAAFRRLTELVRALRRAESDPRYGRWLFVRVETTAAGHEIERCYDSWPAWWHDDGVSGPWRTDLQEETDARHDRWRPSWTPLLDPEIAYRPTS
ncbi:hypothetical protein ACWT_6873 [Actinoplanes sp. SE50]|uniref:hypothetical protein n=1 Tax=unclassified Actinoplanes TaxID=2626549 RepID=UPI00023ED50D|nr:MULTISPECIES: hypothetical protein [unclassified Actinoplanes]AEV87884.1 hypothetical protein ACPL_7004 [Actinoplanes sp. SE50/110]ATO86288.1 hypothetical protein ACWT_6873 [Actinoplanes sp. SE50]SLM03703.1 hypothetical protein ACSP50_7002 [Actinoplanes sp. SE50/110]